MPKARLGPRAGHALPKGLDCATREYAATAYTPGELAEMNRRFHAQMMAAIRAGTERCATSVSTACTRHPIQNYRRAE
jgi:hypothetical protein